MISQIKTQMMTEYSEHDYPLKDLTEKIIGSAFKVHNTLGSGFIEKVYENALVEELRIKGHIVEQQKHINVNYNEKSVGEFIVDVIVDNAVLLEIKAVKKLEDSFHSKLLNYLKANNFQVGLLINFSGSVTIRRIVNS